VGQKEYACGRIAVVGDLDSDRALVRRQEADIETALPQP